MPTKNLQQIVAYVEPDLKVKIEREIAKSKTRTSVSSYVESVLKDHFSKKRDAA